MSYLGIVIEDEGLGDTLNLSISDSITGDPVYYGSNISFAYSLSSSISTIWVSVGADDPGRYTITYDGSGFASGRTVYRGVIFRSTADARVVSADIAVRDTVTDCTYTLSGITESSNITYHTSYSGNGLTSIFKLNGTGRSVRDLRRFSLNGGTIWKDGSSTDISWGSNDPDYDDEQADDTGSAWVSFNTPPASGTSIVFDVVPAFDRATATLTLTDGDLPCILQDFGVDFV